jgi:hypothetical protein
LGETERDEASERQRGAPGISARRSRDGDRQDGERHGERETERGTLVLGRRHCEREMERVRRRSRDGARHGERETKRGMASGRRSEAWRAGDEARHAGSGSASLRAGDGESARVRSYSSGCESY